MTTQEEALRAVDIFSDVLRENEREVCASFSRRGRVFDFNRLQRASEDRRTKLGTRLLKKYRDDTEDVGAIDWEKFKQWCKDHWKAILAAKIILTIMLLFFPVICFVSNPKEFL